MNILVVCPAPPRSVHGNRVTAERWARILRGLDHRVRIAGAYDGAGCDLLIALHARRSADAVVAFHERHPERPVIVALTGTDVYGDIHQDSRARASLDLATRLVVLQPLALDELPPRVRRKTAVIYQSVEKTHGAVRKRRQTFDVCVAAHLREVKDPLRAARAARLLPEHSRIRVLHAGVAIEAVLEREAREEEERNARYRWLGGVSRGRARRLIASSRLLVLSSRLEGGANVISEAMVDGVPVLCSRIPGSVGLLGASYPAFFPYGDTEALAELLWRAESDARFYQRLRGWCVRCAPLFRLGRERKAWRKLLAEVKAKL